MKLVHKKAGWPSGASEPRRSGNKHVQKSSPGQLSFVKCSGMLCSSGNKGVFCSPRSTQREYREQASGKGAEQVASRATRLSSLMDELLENSTRNHSQEEVPECFACPITFATFNDPVVCPNGTTYERSAIEQHLSSNGVHLSQPPSPAQGLGIL